MATKVRAGKTTITLNGNCSMVRSLDRVDVTPGAEPRRMTAQALAREVADLVSLPEVYLRVKQVVDDPEASFATLAEVISVDPGLTARILRLANSAYFGFATRIATLTRAVSVLGTQQIHDFVLATSVIRLFTGIPQGLVDMERFWRTSILCGAGAKVLAERCGILDSERMFIAGVLAHIGHLVLYLRRSELMREIHARARSKAIPLHAVEREILGFDYAEIGGELLAAWNLPSSLVEPVRHHTQPAGLRDLLLEAAIVHIAAALSEDIIGRLDTASVIKCLDDAAWTATALTAEALALLRESAETFAANVIDLFLPRAT